MDPPKLCLNPDGRAYATIPKSGRKRVWFGRYGTPEADAKYRRWLSALLAAEAVAAAPAVAGAPLRGLVDAYLDWAATYYAEGGKPTKEYGNLADTLRRLRESHGGVPAAGFGPNALRAFRDGLMLRGYPDRNTGEPTPYSRGVLNAYCKRVRRFVRWCEARELVPRGTAESLRTVEPLRAGKCPAPEPPPVLPVDWPVARAVLPFLRPDAAAMIRVQYLCGMRPGEVCRMTAGQLDRSGDVWLYRLERHKTRHHGIGLTKGVPPAAQDVLRPFLERVAGGDEPLFLTRWGNPYDTQSYGGAIKRALGRARKAGVPVPLWSPNQLRHAIAEVIDAEFGREDAQHWLGHARPDATAIYAKRKDRILKRIGSSLGRTG